MSTLNKWITAHRDTDVVSKEDLDLAKENERLRREIRLLKEEREILKKATQFFAGCCHINGPKVADSLISS
jgi:transposase